MEKTSPSNNFPPTRITIRPNTAHNHDDSRLSITARDKNLALFPFSTLLPKLSDISELPGMKESLKQRQKELLEIRNAAKTQGSKRTAEDFMLNQVFQWLAVVQGQDEEE